MRSLLTIVLILLVCPICVAQQQPNIILINLDDVDADTLNSTEIGSRFPNLARFVLHGTRFTNMHVTSPICGPSRACLFRSQYAHNTGIRVNSSRDRLGNGMQGGQRHYVEQGYDHDDLSTWLKDAGYRTMMVGKYINGDTLNVVPPGWDDFYSSRGNKYYAPRRFTNRYNPGGQIEILGSGVHRTIAEMNDALRLIDEHQEQRQGEPFFLYLAPLASHKPSRYAPMIEPRYENWWPALHVPRTPGFAEADMSDKRGDMWMLPEVSQSFEDSLDEHHRERVLSLKTVDNQFRRLTAKMNEHGLNGLTYIFLTSDNGWLAGHHRLNGKATPYERASRVPFYALGPGIEATTADHLLAHIDIAPTITRLASGQIPGWIDGISFFDLLFNPTAFDVRQWREPILIENWTSNRTRGLVDPINVMSTALRFYDESYIEWFNGDAEFYDLSLDPHQLENTYDGLSFAEKQFLRNEIRSVKTPMVPLVGLTTPFTDGEVIGRDSALDGIAEDDFGIRAVKIGVRDETTFKYWNGTSWQNNFVQLRSELSNPGGQITRWKLPLNMPEQLATEATMKIWVWAIDLNGNYDRNPKTAFFRLDLSGPQVTIETPTRNQVTHSPVHIEGTATDDSDVTGVRLVIIDRDTRNYWTENGFVTTWSFVNANVYDSTNWNFSAALPNGRYFISARGFDEFGNYTRNIARQIFEVR